MHAGGQTDGRAALDRAEPSRVSDGGPENRRGSGGRVFRRSWDVAADDDANAGLSRLSRFLGAFGAGSWVRSQAGRGPVFFLLFSRGACWVVLRWQANNSTRTKRWPGGRGRARQCQLVFAMFRRWLAVARFGSARLGSARRSCSASGARCVSNRHVRGLAMRCGTDVGFPEDYATSTQTRLDPFYVAMVSISLSLSDLADVELLGREVCRGRRRCPPPPSDRWPDAPQKSAATARACGGVVVSALASVGEFGRAYTYICDAPPFDAMFDGSANGTARNPDEGPTVGPVEVMRKEAPAC
jgi:hypothetical protein